MKHFVNDALLAPNVLKVAVDPAIVAELEPVAADPEVRRRFHACSPGWASDIRWISAATVEDFALFEDVFERLGIAGHVAPWIDCEREVRLYCGFIVERSHCSATDFHVDWDGTDNQAFTLISPIGRPPPGFGLAYRTMTGAIAHYDYRPGEALIFGDHFRHSTRPGRSDSPVRLLSFTFGTDRMRDWPRIARTAGQQGILVRRPDGAFERRDSAGAPALPVS